jgi:hypothetical protein
MILWQEAQTVTVDDGVFNTVLGSVSAFPDSLFEQEPLYLEIAVDDPGGMEVLSPRQPITATAMAIVAETCKGLTVGSLTTAMIADGAVTADQIADGSVGSADMANGAALAEILGDDGAGSGLDADLLDGHSAEEFLSIDGGFINDPITLIGFGGSYLTIQDYCGYLGGTPSGIQFIGGCSHYIEGDDSSDESFGFYSEYSGDRTHDAVVRVHGKASGTMGRYISLSHNGTHGIINTDSGDLLLSPAGDVRLTFNKGVLYPDGSRQTTAYSASVEAQITSLQIQVASLQSEVAALKALLLGVTRAGSDITFSGVNVQIVNGSGNTGVANGTGNLVVGYNEPRGSGDDRSGSHNIVVGSMHNYSSYGGFVAGVGNAITGTYASVSGGSSNVASGPGAVVSGGRNNTSGGTYTLVGGGDQNTASGIGASAFGGRNNAALGDFSFVGGGGGENTDDGNDAFAHYAVVLGGLNNLAGDPSRGDHTIGQRALVSGGSLNIASSSYASVFGGRHNSASEGWSSVSGGEQNSASGAYASVSGGAYNEASGQNASVTGGRNNTASGDFAFVGGGGGDDAVEGNQAFGNYTAVLGGQRNIAGDPDLSDHLIGTGASVSGGDLNMASGNYATISGGLDNRASGFISSIGGGYLNTANNSYAGVSGGIGNVAAGRYSQIGGGSNRGVSGDSDWRAGSLFETD